MQAASPSPSASGGPSPASSVAPAIVLDSGVVRLAADSITINAGGRTFEVAQGPESPTMAIHSDPGDAHYRTLELTWHQHGVEMRINIYFQSDDDSWWVSELRTYNGMPQGDWITYPGPLFEAPLGVGWAGDVVLTSSTGQGPANLVIRGMRLNGFDAGTIPADVLNCRSASEAGGIDVSRIAQMVPAQAHAILRARGICHSFRYGYSYGDGSSGYSERWCVAPPGRITEVTTGGDGLLIIFVEDVVPTLHTPRPQPPSGWGC
jgi:hypothetical protein